MSTLNSHCRLPGIGTFFSGESVTFDDQEKYHEQECAVIDENLFDIMSQPVMDTERITQEDFDILVIVQPDSPVKKPVTDTKRPTRATQIKSEPNVIAEDNSEKIVDYTCTICQKTFPKKQTLDFHLGLHKGSFQKSRH